MILIRLITLALFTLFFIGCSPLKTTFRATFGPDGVLHVHVSHKTQTVCVTDMAGNPLAQSPVFGKETVDILFHWNAHEHYRVLFDDKYGGNVIAPKFRPGYRVRLHAPLGQKTYDFYLYPESRGEDDTVINIPLRARENADILFEIEKLDDGNPAHVQLKVKPDTSEGTLISMTPQIIDDSASLEFEFDKKIWSARASYDSGVVTHGNSLKAHVSIDSWYRNFRIDFTPPTSNMDSIEIASWALPTDQNGDFSPRSSLGLILMPNRVWRSIGSLFGVKAQSLDFYKPFTYQTVRIKNGSNQAIGLMLTSEIMDLNTNKESPFFKAPDNNFTGGTDKIVSFVTIAPQDVEVCVMPVFTDQNTPAGAFSSRIIVQRLGLDRVIKVLRNPVVVVRSNMLFTTWTLGIALLSIGWLIATIFFYRRIVNSLGLRIVVLISLLGSLQFCLSFVGGIVSGITYAILGPFNCLVGGLLTEVITYLLVTSILFLVPRVGTMTLTGIVSYIMGGILFGSFGLTDILFTGSTIAFREIFLFAFGVTKLRASPNPPPIVPMMLALGIAQAASKFTSLTLNTVFYRLYFADWYVVLNVVVTGFFYTLIGVYLGKSLGRSLRKVHL